MSGFSEPAMVKKLAALNNTLPSIQTLSLWLIHHRKHSTRIVDVWFKEFQRERNSQKLLNLLYVANDVIQNSRKKWPLFVEHFEPAVARAMGHAARHCDDKTLAAMTRVLHVWRERGVFGEAAIERLCAAFTARLADDRLRAFSDAMCRTPPRDGADAAVHTRQTGAACSPAKARWTPLEELASEVSSPQPVRRGGRRALDDAADVEDEKELTAADIDLTATAPTDDDDAPPPPTTSELLGALTKLEEPASADAETREKIASFPEAVANPAFLKQIKDAEQSEQLYDIVKAAEPIVGDYCARLAEEMDHRQVTQQMLIAYLKAQKLKAQDTQDLLNQFRERNMRLIQDRREVHKHYESLPDLSKLASSTVLAPLPSAGDLFNK